MRRLAVALLGVTLAACATPRPDRAPGSAPPPAADPPVEPAGLVVRLIWSGPADLDLLVTDPEGRVYSVDAPGGAVTGDAGCDARGADAPRAETARWAAPTPGRYLVGVDAAAPCEVAPVPVSYRLLVDVAGRREAVAGTATPPERIPRALEVTVP